jgi:hypothetical protein
MEIIILNSLLTLVNLLCLAWNYKLENYKTAIFNGFVAGVCFAAALNAL